MTTEPFDDKAHTVIAEILDNAELRLVRTGQCTVDNVSDYLILEYIKQAASLLEYGVVYLDGDGRTAADIFLSKLAFGSIAIKYHRNSRRYAVHLQQHESLYFRRFPEILRMAYLTLINSECSLDTLLHSGLLTLAARSLPGVDVDIRRALRAKGLNYDRTLHLEQRTKRVLPRSTNRNRLYRKQSRN